MAQAMTPSSKQEVTRPAGNGQAMRPALLYQPNADIYETDDRIVVTLDMPGVAPDDVDVTLERGVLTIRGRTPGHPHEGYRRVYAEYGEGDYERVFTLSETIDQERIKAVHTNGVLNLELPKSPAAQPKRIAVKGA